MILGLDMATKTGWCLMDGKQAVASGVQDFSKRRGESNGLMFMRFRKWLVDLMKLAPKPVQLLAYEGAHFRGGAATEICVGFQTHAQGVAAEFGIESTRVPTMTLKKFACGTGKADKDRMKAAAYVILKREPEDDNEADATLVAYWAAHEYLVEG